jgi:hypothetical protein
VVLLHQQIVHCAGNDEVRTGAQVQGEVLDRGKRYELVVSGGEQEHRLVQARGIGGVPQGRH